MEIEEEQVVAMAESMSETEGATAGRRAAQHLTDVERQQLGKALLSRCHLFASEKGYLGRMSLVQHHINTGDHPAVKQRVQRYLAARMEEEWRLLEDMLAIWIIQESTSAWSSPTVLVKKKDGSTRFVSITRDSTRSPRWMHTPYHT